MKAVLLSLLILPAVAFGQDNQVFNWMAQTLANNARYTTPVPWEGSQRLQTLIAAEMSKTKDSVKKAESLEYKALSSLKHGNYDQAFTDYELATQLNPKSRGRVGWRYLFFLRDYTRGLAHLNAFDALTPTQDDPIDDYSVNYLKGRAYAGLKKYEPAIVSYTIAIDNRETRYGSDWVDYRYFVARAVSFLASNQSEKALIDLDKALKNHPKSAMAHYHRGRALQQLARITEARDAFQNALFFVHFEPFERDYYYEQPDAAYDDQIEVAIDALKK
jgi:tetratricopeptide (TPR) repeat protein